MAPVVFNSSQVLREAEVLKTSISAKRKDDFSVGGELWSSCQSLQDLYKSLLLSDLSYSLEKKVEIELWNSAFKSHIDNMRQQIKEKKGNKKVELQALFMLFLETASGFYIQLLNELCLKYTLEVPGYINPALLGILHDVNSNKKIVKRPSSSACYYICQDCLVHLGDLARYRNETVEAELYYKQALQLVPANGQPYNQLAILASSRGDTLGTVYFYCRSIAVKNQFPAASTNLTKTLSKTIQNANGSQPTGQMSKLEFIQVFIQFHGSIYLAQDLKVAKSLTERTVNELKGILESDELTASDLIKLVTINLFLLNHIQTNGSDDIDDFDSSAKDELWDVTLDFTMRMFECFVSRVIHCEAKTSDASTVNSVLPAVNVLCQWFKINALNICKDDVFINQQQLWTDFVDMLNGFATENGPEKSEAALPEDQELQGFLPLQSVHRKLDFSSSQNSKKEDQQDRKNRILHFGLCLARRCNGLVSCQKKDNGYYKFSFVTDKNGSKGTNTPFFETSSLFGNTSDTNRVKSEPVSPIDNPVGQYSLFQSGWNVPLTVGSTVANFVPSSPSSSSPTHPSKPSTLVNNIQESPPLVTSRAVGSHRSPTFPNPGQSLPMPPTSLAVGSNRPLSPGSRITPSPNGEKTPFTSPASFGLHVNIGPGVWSPLAHAAANGHQEPSGKLQSCSNGSSIWGSGFHSAQSNMSPLEQLLKEQKSQQNS